MNDSNKKCNVIQLPNGQKMYGPTVPYLTINYKSKEQISEEERYERLVYKTYGEIKGAKTPDRI